MTEVDEKVERVARAARTRELGGIVISQQRNFAWLTGGQSNRIDGSVSTGAGSLLISAAGDRYVVANAIEMPRLRDEALAGLGFERIEYPWTDDEVGPSPVVTIGASQLGLRSLGSDTALPGLVDLGREIALLQTPLTATEVDRYRALGRDIAGEVERVCRTLEPGITEQAAAALVIGHVARTGARAIVTLVGADDRLSGFRHPVPTSRRWRQTLLVGLCAERDGLVVALSRLIAVKPPAALRDRTMATARVFGTLLAATRPGTDGATLFATAAQAYREVGYPGEEARHHQGGAIGYRSRDWIAHPRSEDVVQSRQAFAWNPSITGTKVEDTALVTGDGVELITATGEWPSVAVSAGSFEIAAPALLAI